MGFDSIFSYISFISYVLLFIIIYLYVKKIISKNGFNGLSIFILTFTMFYIVTPFFQTFFKKQRDDTSLFTQLLNNVSDSELYFNMLLCLACLLIVVFSYNVKIRSNKNRNITKEKISYIPALHKKIGYVTDALLLISVTSILILIMEVGSLDKYLMLGTLTRGLDKSPTDYISSGALQLVTLSVIILVTPFLYFYLYRLKKSKIIFSKLLISLLFSILFLLYNQGRAPLIIFFLPFLLTFNKSRKKSFVGITVLFALGIFLLNYLDALFQYLSYGQFDMDERRSFITLFLSEFSYPFTNFVLREDLVSYSGFRYALDYIIWPFTMIPSMFLDPVGISKESLISVSNFNTSAYGDFLGVIPSGGIPVDFLTLNYYQLGYITLIIFSFITGKILRKLDQIFYFFNDNLAIKIILFRISLSIVNILNNADPSAVIRNRLDVVVLLIVLVYIYRKMKVYSEPNLFLAKYNKKEVS